MKEDKTFSFFIVIKLFNIPYIILYNNIQISIILIFTNNIIYDKIKYDFDGYKHTYDIANAADYNADLFKAIDYCINYSTEGTNKGDWHLGATGEMFAIAKNLIFINTAIMLVGIGETLNLKWYWTSSQYYDGQYIYSWYVTLDDGNSGMRGCRDYKHQVLPLLAFTKQA